jgi:stage III sporulation protein AG
MKADLPKMHDLKKTFEFLKRYKVVLVVLFTGIILLLLPDGDAESKNVINSSEYTTNFDLDEIESRMEKILSNIEGVGNLSLMLTVNEDFENIFAANREYREGENNIEERLEIITVSKEGGNEEPVLERRKYPSFQGALVVCDGGDDPEVKLLITKAVAALTGLGTDRISVCR